MALAIVLLALLGIVFIISVLFCSVKGGNIWIKLPFVLIMGLAFIACFTFFIFRILDNGKYPVVKIVDNSLQFDQQDYYRIDKEFWQPQDLPNKTVAIVEPVSSSIFGDFSNWIAPTYIQIDDSENILATYNSRVFVEFYISAEMRTPDLFNASIEAISLTDGKFTIDIDDEDVADEIYGVLLRLLDIDHDYFYSYRKLVPVQPEVDKRQYEVNIEFTNFPFLYTNLILTNTVDQKWVAFLKETGEANNLEIATVYLSDELAAYLSEIAK